MTHSTTSDDDLEALLGDTARLAKVCKPRIGVLLEEGGLIFQAAKPPFFLRHYVSFIQLRAGGLRVAQAILDNMRRELEQAQKDAAEARNMSAV